MRAAVVEEFGGPEVLRVAELPLPQPGPGQVRVRVTASTVNAIDLATRAGAFAANLPPAASPPYVLGWDVSGTVDALGEGVYGFAEGAPVVGLQQWFEQGVGTYAEYAVLPVGALAPAPAGVDLIAAATLPLNALIARQALDLLALPSGADLLIAGAAGAVGGYAVELAHARGLRVVALARPGDADLVASLGAADLVPRGDDPGAAVRAQYPDGLDGVLDAAGIGTPLLPAARDGGVFHELDGSSVPPPERGVRVDHAPVRADGVQLAELTDLAAQGRLTLRVAGALPLDQAAHAHRRTAAGGLHGHLVLTT